MTEKRFKEIISTQKIIDNHTGKEYDCLLDNDLFDLINDLAEENEQSKKHREELFYRERDAKNDWRKLKYKNEQLKVQIDDVTNESIGYEEQIEKLLKKNEQLKQLAEGNEELLLKVMSYLHDNHYDIWEEVNKECFLKELGDD